MQSFGSERRSGYIFRVYLTEPDVYHEKKNKIMNDSKVVRHVAH